MTPPSRATSTLRARRSARSRLRTLGAAQRRFHLLTRSRCWLAKAAMLDRPGSDTGNHQHQAHADRDEETEKDGAVDQMGTSKDGLSHKELDPQPENCEGDVQETYD